MDASSTHIVLHSTLLRGTFFPLVHCILGCDGWNLSCIFGVGKTGSSGDVDCSINLRSDTAARMDMVRVFSLTTRFLSSLLCSLLLRLQGVCLTHDLLIILSIIAILLTVA